MSRDLEFWKGSAIGDGCRRPPRPSKSKGHLAAHRQCEADGSHSAASTSTLHSDQLWKATGLRHRHIDCDSDMFFSDLNKEVRVKVLLSGLPVSQSKRAKGLDASRKCSPSCSPPPQLVEMQDCAASSNAPSTSGCSSIGRRRSSADGCSTVAGCDRDDDVLLSFSAMQKGRRHQPTRARAVASGFLASLNLQDVLCVESATTTDCADNASSFSSAAGEDMDMEDAPLSLHKISTSKCRIRATLTATAHVSKGDVQADACCSFSDDDSPLSSPAACAPLPVSVVSGGIRISNKKVPSVSHANSLLLEPSTDRSQDSDCTYLESMVERLEGRTSRLQSWPSGGSCDDS